jgi:hypothetical protein
MISFPRSVLRRWTFSVSAWMAPPGKPTIIFEEKDPTIYVKKASKKHLIKALLPA